MPECAACGDTIESHFSCSYCGATLCGDHRLPENHACNAVRSLTPLSQKKQVNEPEGIKSPEPMELDDSQVIGSSGGPELDRAPDVAPDGSVADEHSTDDEDDSSGSGGFLAWFRSFF